MNLDDIITRSRAATDQRRAARDTITRLISHTDQCADLDDAYRADDHHDIAHAALRILLISRAAADPDFDLLDLADELRSDLFSYDISADHALRLTTDLRDALRTIMNDDSSDAREYLTTLALDQSLCPLHLIDYAICFDDRDDECAAIRAIHPSHDT